jgi:DNA-binding CsgD family transcriptional regulator
LALLFQLYKKRQALVLLERSGRRPGHSSSVDALTETEQHLSGKVRSMDARENEPDRIQPFADERPEHIEIALDGLFGMTLDMQGFLHIPNVHSDPRSLEEERYWAWHGGHVIVSAIGAKRREEDMRGVLVLCFGPEQPEAEMDALEEGNLLICHEFRMNEPGVRIDYQVENLDIWPPSLEIPVYRLIQEALNNVRKHAQASRVTVRIQALTGLLIVQVRDNGTGFLIGRSSEDTTAEEATTSLSRKNPGFHAARVTFGLRTMQERVRQAGGILEISSKPGKGTTIKARFPLKEPSLVLTRREREVLQLLVEGATNRIIAQKLSVSIETVKSHVHHIMQKMQVKDRTQAAVVATRQRWL